MRLNRSSEKQSPPQTQSAGTLRKAPRIIFLAMNSRAMKIHHKNILMGINYGRLRVGVASRGFPQVSGGPM